MLEVGLAANKQLKIINNWQNKLKKKLKNNNSNSNNHLKIIYLRNKLVHSQVYCPGDHLRQTFYWEINNK